MTEQIHQKLLSCSTLIGSQRCWNKQQMNTFKSWLIRSLRRDSEARNLMIDAPKKWNNRTQVLDQFAVAFIASVGFKYI